MITRQNQLQTPLTHIFLACAAYSIISSFLILYKLFTILCISTIVLFLLNYLYFKNIKIASFCLFFSILVLIRIQQKENSYNSDINFLNKELIITGCIQNIQHNLQDKKTTSISLNKISLYNKDTGSLKTDKTILLQLPHKRSKNLELGQRVKLFKVKLIQPLSENDYHKYLIKENIWATGYISSQNFYLLKKRYTNWYQKYFIQLSNYFQTKTSHLYNPLFLGKKEKDSLFLDIQHQSLYWGIAHHMARSGIHLITILGLFISIFHYARLFHRFRFLLYAMLVIFYAFISISSISFTRSLLMVLFQMFAKFNGFIYSSSHAFLLTVIIIILYNPYSVLFLDFQLSFGITAIILWLFYIKWNKIIAFQIPTFINS